GINNIMKFQVREMANQIDEKHFTKTTINVRGRKKTYHTFEKNGLFAVSCGPFLQTDLIIGLLLPLRLF
ncbi:MAG: hypothetical protein WBK06_10695, partial [Methanothrix sp.]